MQPRCMAAVRGQVDACSARRLVAGACEPQSVQSARNAPGQLGRRALRSASLSRQQQQRSVAVRAKGKSEPPDVPKARPKAVQQGGHEWLQTILSRFGPVKERASNTTVLDFEKPLVELDNRIKEVRVRRQRPDSAAFIGAEIGMGMSADVPVPTPWAPPPRRRRCGKWRRRTAST